MELLDDDLRGRLPALYANAAVADPLVVCRFFLPGTGWSWYALEFDGNDVFFGYVIGDDAELGYFSLQELRALQGPYGGVERDYYFEARPFSEAV